ncbi:unnamed protein product, partial [marine sediment metagenome]
MKGEPGNEGRFSYGYPQETAAIYKSHVVAVVQNKYIHLATDDGGIKLPDCGTEGVTHLPEVAESDFHRYRRFDHQFHISVFRDGRLNIGRVAGFPTCHVDFSADGNIPAAELS